ncbi:MAG: DUF4256 domain-containing protein [Pseudorhodoferax sp.]
MKAGGCTPCRRVARPSSRVQTPAGVRAPGGASFCDRRHGQVFVCHNGARSYCAARGFRGLLQVQD